MEMGEEEVGVGVVWRVGVDDSVVCGVVLAAVLPAALGEV